MKKKEKIFPEKKRATFWVDFYHHRNGSMEWGIECDNPNFTFDGKFVGLFGENEKDGERASKICDLLNMYLPPMEV